MTLDIPKFIENSIRTQSKIHHLDVNVKAVKKDEVPKSVSSLVYKDYGEKYLDDADYVAFFWGGINKDNIDKLFNVVDKALGKSANKLTDKDFKKLDMSGESKGEDTEDVEDTEDETSDDSIDDQDNDEDQDDEEDVEIEVDDDSNDNASDDEDDSSDNDSEDDEKDDEDEDVLNEDDEEIEVDIEEKPVPTSYFFLKVTMK